MNSRPGMGTAGISLRQIYRNRFSGTESARSIVWQVLAEFFQRWIDPSHIVLDLGSGYCEFINAIKAGKKLAIDLNTVTQAKASDGVEVICQDITSEWPMASESVDVIFSSNFLEHLPHKAALHSCLAEVERVIRPGGTFIAMGPNIRFCYDVYWDFVDHMIPLSDRSLAEALKMVGLSPEIVFPKFLPFTMVGKKPSITLLRLYLRMPIFWQLFGQQFLIIARKAK